MPRVRLKWGAPGHLSCTSWELSGVSKGLELQGPGTALPGEDRCSLPGGSNVVPFWL